MSEPYVGESCEVRIERYADQGRCVAHIDGQVVFVRFALPGELVRIALDEPLGRRRRYLTGEVAEVLEPSDHRVHPPWPLAGPLAEGGGVGGADLIHVDLPGQLQWKSAVITEQLRRLGHVECAEVPVGRPAGDEALGGLNWRTRIDLIADGQGRPSMRRRGSHERVALETMPLATRALLEVARSEGVWSHAFAPSARIRVTVPEPDAIDTAQAESEELLHAVGGNMAILADGKLLAGEAKVRECVEVGAHAFTYEVDADGFWQVHRAAPHVLADCVLSAVLAGLDSRAAPVIWDLYSGSGLFTLPLAGVVGGARVLSVEGERRAAANARHNLRDAGLTNVTAQVGDVQTALRHAPHSLAHPDAVVLDPPRAGAKAEVCRLIAQAGPGQIIYVACDPTSLARDTDTLRQLGYRLGDVQAFDIYPMTHHVETVAVFERQGARG